MKKQFFQQDNKATENGAGLSIESIYSLLDVMNIIGIFQIMETIQDRRIDEFFKIFYGNAYLTNQDIALWLGVSPNALIYVRSITNLLQEIRLSFQNETYSDRFKEEVEKAYHARVEIKFLTEVLTLNVQREHFIPLLRLRTICSTKKISTHWYEKISQMLLMLLNSPFPECKNPEVFTPLVTMENVDKLLDRLQNLDETTFYQDLLFIYNYRHRLKDSGPKMPLHDVLRPFDALPAQENLENNDSENIIKSITALKQRRDSLKIANNLKDTLNVYLNEIYRLRENEDLTNYIAYVIAIAEYILKIRLYDVQLMAIIAAFYKVCF